MLKRPMETISGACLPERAAGASALHQRRKERRRRKAASFISQPTPLRRPVVLIVPFVAAVVLETISVKREPSADASIGISMGPPRHTRGVSVSAGVLAADCSLAPRYTLEISARFHTKS